MEIITNFLSRFAEEGPGVRALVPTMGALHEGHLSLIRAARQECDQVTVSILVNPLQFGPNEDYKTYPRTLERDLELCKAEGVDTVFCPNAEDVYPPGFQMLLTGGPLTQKYCGVTRPTFFNGVLTVVSILFNHLRPHRAYFGEKDFQQLFLIKQMVKDLRMPVEIRPMSIIREPSGLALSSRNAYLNEKQREEATCLFQGLLAAREAAQCGERDVQRLLQIARKKITLDIDYLSLVSTQTLVEIHENFNEPVRMLLAAYIGDSPRVRLIDNLQIL